jgi:hypothetical protein
MGSSGKPQFANHARRRSEAMMRGHQREAAAREVAIEQVDEEGLSGIVEGREGFIESPHFGGIEGQAGKPDAASLSCGQAARRDAAAFFRAGEGRTRDSPPQKGRP